MTLADVAPVPGWALPGSLGAAAATCAREPFSARVGLSDACAAVLDTCTPPPSKVAWAAWYASHMFVFGAIGAGGAAVGFALLEALRWALWTRKTARARTAAAAAAKFVVPACVVFTYIAVGLYLMMLT